MREWKTDTYGATGLAYDLELEALNAQGQVLAEKSTRGEEELGGSAWMFDPQSHTQEVTPQAFKQKVEQLYLGGGGSGEGVTSSVERRKPTTMRCARGIDQREHTDDNGATPRRAAETQQTDEHGAAARAPNEHTSSGGHILPMR